MGALADNLHALGDAALMVAIGRWRSDALAEVYRRHGGAVFALARRVTGDRSRAEDVTQVVFTTIWDQVDRFDPERGSLRSYLLTLAHRRSVDLLRSERRRTDREARLGALAEAPYDLEREVWDLSLGERVRGALEGLGAGERQAIELAYFGGHTYREVAAMLGEAEGTVKSRIRYGLRRLRAALVDVGAVE
ncbi:MAG TPA: sigma-70 family RNA polymerase sigma factor [Acidimicrobiales bacterium]|nr:sigma-70 family RNA polymerase sigma factor [Acidimicrobiales bacterium]